jgi:hypothetical protein
MECLFVFIAIIVGVFFLLGLGSRRSPRSGRLMSAYRRLAARYGGTCRRPGMFSYPYVEFNHRSVRAHLRVTTSATNLVSRGPATQLTIPWPDSGLVCEVRYPRPDRLAPADNGLREMSTGQPEMSQYYSIRGTDQAALMESLNEVVRWQIEKIRRTPPSGSLCIQFLPSRLTITKAYATHHYMDVERFVEESLELYDQVMLTRSKGIEFTEQHSAQVLDEVVCRVCGEEIVEDLVFCRRCKTPHHRECWQYNGVCSVFACGETHFQAPSIAQEVSPSEDMGGNPFEAAS